MISNRPLVLMCLRKQSETDFMRNLHPLKGFMVTAEHNETRLAFAIEYHNLCQNLHPVFLIDHSRFTLSTPERVWITMVNVILPVMSFSMTGLVVGH